MKTHPCTHHFILMPDRNNCTREMLSKLRLRCSKNGFWFVCRIPARTHARRFRKETIPGSDLMFRQPVSSVAAACFGLGPPDMEYGD